ncbi:defensin-like peptide family protein [Acinetobacter baumannii 1419130]|nr:defensin-like peptide family protein [Acinetobacter baumannii 1419130]
MNFLNGVCRHEQKKAFALAKRKFLNGVCRHELTQRAYVVFYVVSKWRMPP